MVGTSEQTDRSDVELVHSGKVRDVYLDHGEDVILVASDRISVYDVVLPTPIPDKGRILTQLSLWWFDQLADLVPHHVISGTEVPAEWAGRAMRCRRLTMVPVECIARGYLAGLGLREYEAGGAVSGVPLPAGLLEGSRLPEPIFTPTTKSAPGAGVHDEFITFDDVVRRGRRRPGGRATPRSRWRSTAGARTSPPSGGSSSRTPSSSSAWRPTAP